MPELDLTSHSARDRAFQVRPARARAVLRLKSWQSHDTAGAPRVLAGCELPSAVGTQIEGMPRVLCTGPGEWLMLYAPTGVARLREILAPELKPKGFALVDLTDGLSVLEVSGSGVREVLGKSCGLDFDPRRFAVRHCARTRFAQIPVVIDCIQDGEVFELYAARSHAAYLKSWLLDAAVECRDGST